MEFFSVIQEIDYLLIGWIQNAKHPNHGLMATVKHQGMRKIDAKEERAGAVKLVLNGERNQLLKSDFNTTLY